MPRDLQAQADELEKWWKRDTKEAALSEHIRTENWSENYDNSATQHQWQETCGERGWRLQR
ncbi:hypothetical protein FVEG_17646 [Fusarium verticillioides 7600]|uniref:Uncharacterized protein n=1 Tax=Gibberella moniliformis (strain M3125 / FGSC 7600) TaxID=334819 RepID=A0A139YBP2_GIBM7|nr:hypothetical protein FVEG_17646 [Fusarium verticillioides 7600]KYG13613.1 hypothetical protein FVEG_17646 [Fusarium verticillioides 7600]